MKKVINLIFITICLFSLSFKVKAGDHSYGEHLLPEVTGTIYEYDSSERGGCENPLYLTEEACVNNKSIWFHMLYDKTSGPTYEGISYISINYNNPLPSKALLIDPNGIKCTRTDNWDSNLRYAVATSISSLANKSPGDKHINYLYSMLAINDVVYEKTNHKQGVKFDEEKYELIRKDLYTQYREEIIYAYNTSYKPLSIDSLNLTVNGVTNSYEGTSKIINLTGDMSVTKADVLLNGKVLEEATILINGDELNVSIPSELLDAKANVELSVEIKNKPNETPEYFCSGTYEGVPYQSIIPIDWEDPDYPVKIKNKIGPDKVHFIINQIDEEENPFDASTLYIESSDGSFSEEFNDSTKDFILDFGKTYYLTEKVTANGYIKVSKKYEIEVIDDENIKVDGEKSDGDITIKHKQTKFKIKNQSTYGQNLLNGKFSLKQGENDVACSIKKSDGTITNLTTCEWTVDENVTKIVGLNPGEYNLTQLQQPKGFEKNNDVVTFKLKSDGTITDSEDNELSNILVKNDYTKLTVDIIDGFDDSKLKGAKLRLLDKDKKSMSCSYLKDGELETLDTCEWVSGEDSMIIVGLESGTYYLHEVSVLDPYIIEGNLKEIVIPENGKSQSIKIINDRQSEEPEDPENNETTEEVEVPDTGVTRSNTLIIISIICMVLGSVLVIFSKHKQKAC